MKNQIKLLLILLAIILTNNINSQSISTSIAQYCDWDSNTKEWKDCTTDNDYNSLIVINDQQTMITHTTSDNKSVYYVESKSIVYNDLKEKEWVYNLISDTGTKYIMKVNPVSRRIFCVYTVENEVKETIFVIKSIF
jgi:hypothetical protein